VRGQILRISFVVLVALGLGACGFFQDNLFKTSFWSSSPLQENDLAELGIAELAKGNYVTAEGHFQQALRKNGKDVHALLGAGILYQNTGQLTKARKSMKPFWRSGPTNRNSLSSGATFPPARRRKSPASTFRFSTAATSPAP
jgi:Tfp pilus assembly protein PilF